MEREEGEEMAQSEQHPAKHADDEEKSPPTADFTEAHAKEVFASGSFIAGDERQGAKLHQEGRLRRLLPSEH